MKRLYIDDLIHEQLKREAKAQGRTLQWVVENKLTWETPPSPKKYEPETLQLVNKGRQMGQSPAMVDDLISGLLRPTEELANDRQSDGELECCKHPSHPCKHWVWDIDTGEGYKNTLSGRYREAD